jgi:hypothetical protein
MLPKPIEYRFTIEGDDYLLVEYDRGGERRLKAEYALAIAAAPEVLDSLDGRNLYAEAVARECLKEAPPIFWETRPAGAAQNGQPTRVVTLEHIPRALWEQFREGVDRFLGMIFPALSAEPGPAPDPGPAEPVALAAAQAVSPVLRGRAE